MEWLVFSVIVSFLMKECFFKWLEFRDRGRSIEWEKHLAKIEEDTVY